MRKAFMFALIGAFALSGCATSKMVRGYKAPDETQVIDGPSLALPPSYELRPPRKAEDYNARISKQKTEEAQRLIIGGEQPQNTATSTEEDWFFEQAGTQADPAIRQKIEDDYKVQAVEDKKTFWQRQKERMFPKEEDTTEKPE